MAKNMNTTTAPGAHIKTAGRTAAGLDHVCATRSPRRPARPAMRQRWLRCSRCPNALPRHRRRQRPTSRRRSPLPCTMPISSTTPSPRTGETRRYLALEHRGGRGGRPGEVGMIGMAAAPAPVLAIAELRERGWRFIEVVVPSAPPGVPEVMRRMFRVRYGAWLSIPPDRARYPSKPSGSTAARRRCGGRPASRRHGVVT